MPTATNTAALRRQYPDLEEFSLVSEPNGDVWLWGFGVYPRHSVLSGQHRQVRLECYDDVEEARAAHPDVPLDDTIPLPTEHHSEVLGDLFSDSDIRGNLVPDAHLAALAIEHGLLLCSTDGDFARFPGLRWENPLTEK